MSTTVAPQINLALCEVTTVRVTDDHRLTIRFCDGLVAALDFADHVNSPGPVLEPLRDPTNFALVTIDDGILTWPNGYDIDPVSLRTWAERGYLD